MIEIRNLSRSFGERRAVDSISFKVDSGEIVGFLGPNGAGKTTTMRMMVGYLQPDAGEILLDAASIFDNPLAANARIGYLAEHNPLYDEMSVEEFLGYIGSLRQMQASALTTRLEFVKEKCGLAQVWHQSIKTLSKGYRQRTGLAQAMLHDPDVLILDEPTGGLDPNQIMEIRSLISELGKEKTVLLSSHIMQEVQALCSRVVIINQGQIIVDDYLQNLSSYIEGVNRVVLEIEAEQPDFAGWLAQFPEVHLDSLLQNGSTAVCEFLAPPEVDIRRDLSAFVQAQGWQLLSIYQERQSLEQIFHELTSVRTEVPDDAVIDEESAAPDMDGAEDSPAPLNKDASQKEEGEER